MAKVYFRHLRALSYCKPRIIAWCKQHNIPRRAFRDGIESDTLRKTGCGLAVRAADLADNEASPDHSDGTDKPIGPPNITGDRF